VHFNLVLEILLLADPDQQLSSLRIVAQHLVIAFKVGQGDRHLAQLDSDLEGVVDLPRELQALAVPVERGRIVLELDAAVAGLLRRVEAQHGLLRRP
jgi:hypothetical protein